MAQAFAKSFYESNTWKRCRNAFMKSQLYSCARCGDAAVIAHHIVPITMENINNPAITLNWDNLEALCTKCHNAVHGGAATANGVSFDANGNIICMDTPPM